MEKEYVMLYYRVFLVFKGRFGEKYFLAFCFFVLRICGIWEYWGFLLGEVTWVEVLI